MRHLVITGLTFLLFTSACDFIFTNDISQIQKAIQSELIYNMNDPSSFEFIEMEIIDSTKYDQLNIDDFKLNSIIEDEGLNQKTAYLTAIVAYRERNENNAIVRVSKEYEVRFTTQNDVEIFWSAYKDIVDECRKVDYPFEGIMWNFCVETFENNARSQIISELEKLAN